MLLEYITEYNKETECPKRYHQWCYLSAVAAMLGRNVHMPFGHDSIFANQYIMLIGSPAARKSSAIKAAVKLLQSAGYDTISKGRTSKEKFLLDLSGHVDDTGTKHSQEAQLGGRQNHSGSVSAGTQQMYQNLYDMDLTELIDEDSVHETLIAADEFTNYVGAGNYEFISILGELWDNPPDLPVRIKNSKSYNIIKPCVNILAGNTPTGFAAAFPPEMLGQGFASRLLLVYGERTDVKITLPKPPCPIATEKLAAHLARIRMEVTGEITLDINSPAYEALDWLYKNWQSIDDTRFANYSGRRFSHLLKICVLFAANALRTNIEYADVIAANTLLAITELDMPKALGEFGKGKFSDVSNKIMEYINTCDSPQSMVQIWKHINTDLEKIVQLTDIVNGLVRADKLQNTKGGFLPIKKVLKVDNKYFDASLIGGI